MAESATPPQPSLPGATVGREPFAAFFAGWGRDAEGLDEAAITSVLARIDAVVKQALEIRPELLDGLWTELARCLPADTTPTSVVDGLERLHVVDLYLAYACRRGDRAALRQFESACLAKLRPAIARVDPRDSFGDEVLQRVRTKLLVSSDGQPAKIAYYTGRGDLATWLKVVAVRESISLARANGRRSATETDDLETLESTASGPDLAVLKQVYQPAFSRAFTQAIAELSPEQRNLLRLHYLHGLTIDDLGRLASINRSSAARRLTKARQQLLAGTRQRLQQTLVLTDSELDAVVRVASSRIDLSIERLLGDAP